MHLLSLMKAAVIQNKIRIKRRNGIIPFAKNNITTQCLAHYRNNNTESTKAPEQFIIIEQAWATPSEHLAI